MPALRCGLDHRRAVSSPFLRRRSGTPSALLATLSSLEPATAMSNGGFAPLPDVYSFPDEERQISSFWKTENIFAKSLTARDGCERFVFYEGPPTANGKPHPGHVLDARRSRTCFRATRRCAASAFRARRGGTRTDLPVEIEVEKELEISGKEDIEKPTASKNFTRRCIESVFRYTREWEELTERIGFWVDLGRRVRHLSQELRRERVVVPEARSSSGGCSIRTARSCGGGRRAERHCRRPKSASAISEGRRPERLHPIPLGGGIRASATWRGRRHPGRCPATSRSP